MIPTVSLRSILYICALSTTFGVSAQEADTLRTHLLHDVVVKGHRASTYLKSAPGVSVVDLKMLDFMPRIMGNADPMHYAQLLPGVQTNSEYDAGLHIQGCDNAHNVVSVCGIPLYHVSHMLGFFSIFNASHFSTLRLDKSPVAASSANRLGGTVDMQCADTLVRHAGGDLSVGPLSSQATVRIPLGRRSALVLSAREAYINLLYSRWLTTDDGTVRYAFGDYDLSYLYRPDDRNLFRIEAYLGHDHIRLGDENYAYTTRMKWGNRMVSAHWTHRLPSATLTQRLYYTGYQNHFTLNQANIHVGLKSDIYDLGYKADFSSGRWKAGMDWARHSLQPQAPEVTGAVSSGYAPSPRRHSTEMSVYGSRSLPLGQQVEATLGLRATAFVAGPSQPVPRTAYFSIDPGLTVSWAISEASVLSLNAGLRHQYLFQTGFSNMGLPTEFWFSAGAGHAPQYAFNLSLGFDTYLGDKTYHLSAEVYGKRLFHQVEYEGNVFDFVYSTYHLDKALLWGHGHNYGLNLLVEKRRGRLTGWVSYALGRAMRRYPNTVYTGSYPASHERIHELNAVATCRIGRRWSLGGTFVAAMGTPYTAVERAYLVSSHLLVEYGPHNGSRVGPYGRVDLSASYDFKMRQGRRSGINFSLYNVTMRRNPLFYYLYITQNGQNMGYRTLSFALRLLPSVNYYYRF